MSFESRLANKNSADFAVMLHRLENLLPYISSEPMVALSQYPDSSWAEWIALRLLDEGLEGNEHFVDMTVTGSGNDVPAQLYNVAAPLTGYTITSNGMDAWLTAIGVPYTKAQLHDMAFSRNHMGAFYKACYTILDNVGWYVNQAAYVPGSMTVWRGTGQRGGDLISPLTSGEKATYRSEAISTAISNWSELTENFSFGNSMRRSTSLTVDAPHSLRYLVSAAQIFVSFKVQPAFGFTFTNKCSYSLYFGLPAVIPGDVSYSPSDSAYTNYSDAGIPVSTDSYVLLEGDVNNQADLGALSDSSRIAADFLYDAENKQYRNGWETGGRRFFVKLNLDE